MFLELCFTLVIKIMQCVVYRFEYYAMNNGIFFYFDLLKLVCVCVYPDCTGCIFTICNALQCHLI